MVQHSETGRAFPRVVFVGDLHIYPWQIFPKTSTGVNEYLEHVKHLFESALPELLLEWELGKVDGDTLVFLGDLAEEPYKLGTINVEGLQTLIQGFENLGALLAARFNQLPRIFITSGNHDLIAPGKSWMSGVLPSFVEVCDQPHQVPLTNQLGLALVPYMQPEEIKRYLTRLVSTSGKTRWTVCGHFLVGGVKMDNGQPFRTNETVTGLSPMVSRGLDLFVLGHAHTPQDLVSSSPDAVPVVYPGVPLPYSFACTRPGHIVCLGCNGDSITVEKAVKVPGPRFAGTIPFKDAVELAALQPETFCRVALQPDQDTAALADLRKRYPELRLTPTYDLPETSPVSQHQARVAELASLGQDNTDHYEALVAYVNYKKPEIPAADLLRVGADLIGVACDSEDEGVENDPTTED